MCEKKNHACKNSSKGLAQVKQINHGNCHIVAAKHEKEEEVGLGRSKRERAIGVCNSCNSEMIT